MKNTLRSFDVDFSPCDCKGTVHQQTNMQVIAVRWKRTDKDPNGRIRFQCMRCKTSWSMNNVRGGKILKLNDRHPEEIARRAAISRYYNEDIAVNLGGSSSAPGYSPGGTVSGRVSCAKPGHL